MRNILDYSEVDENTTREWRLFVGVHSLYYVREWTKILSGYWFSFNWAAFFFNIFWLLYRRMVNPAILYLSIYFAEGYLEDLLWARVAIPVSSVKWFYIRLFLFFLALGFLGNWIYLDYTRHRIRQIKDRFPEDYRKKLRKSGGVSIWPVVLFVLVFFLILFASRNFNFFGFFDHFLSQHA